MTSLRRKPFKDMNNIRRVPCKSVSAPNKRQKCKKNLRQRKVDNYKELSFNKSSTSKGGTTMHVPIYLQNIGREKKKKNKDPFEFEDSTPTKQKSDSSGSDSTIYDKSMHELLHQIRLREKKKPMYKRRKKKVKSETKENQPQVFKTSNCNLVVSARITESPQAEPCTLPTSTPVPHKNKPLTINILSNIQIQSPQRTLSPLSSLGDDIQLPDWDHYSKDENMQPWRGDNLNLRRNPHWLALKDSSLPNYNQEMILEPDLIEKFPQPKSTTKRCSSIQPKIINYTESPPENIEISNASSLFDDHSLSPLKNERINRLPLAPLNTERMNSQKQLDINTSFGFSFSASGKENISPVTRSSLKKPMRVSPRDVKKLRKEAVEKLVQNVEEVNVSIPMEHDESVHLFEDLRVDDSLKHTYAIKRRKKHAFEIKHCEDKPKKKRENLKTQVEEKEFNKWAANFNAMCEEVEQHSLEIV